MAQVGIHPVAESKPRTVRNALVAIPQSVTNADPLVPKESNRFASYMKVVKQGASAGDTLGTGYNWVRASWDRPSPTIPKALSFGGYHMVWHPEEHRNFTGRELARLASFPDAFEFAGSYVDWASRIGNSVPPLFMRSIAARISAVVLGKESIMPLSDQVDYPAILAEAWAQHLAPREADAPTVISTFAGCGGSSLGYSMAGYHELLAVEWDDNAVETFRLNFPGVPVYHGDIAKLSVDECLRLAGIGPGEIDVLDGSPPCQGFSTAGKRNMDDDRNQLFREYVRLLRGLRPKVFVMENVSGLVKGKMKLIFAEIMRELKASGYKVSCRLMNAMYFNVPQSRQRLIFIGVRDDLAIEPSHPGAEAHLIAAKDAIPG